MLQHCLEDKHFHLFLPDSKTPLFTEVFLRLTKLLSGQQLPSDFNRLIGGGEEKEEFIL